MPFFDRKYDKNGQKCTENAEECCPECSSRNVIISGRCVTCMECGWSKCDL